MCGICGVIQVQGEPRAVLPPGVLDRMTDAMTHRGPNDRGTYTAPGVAFGVRRLSVVDVDGGYTHEFTTAQVHYFLEQEYGPDYTIKNPQKFAVFEDHLIYADDVVRMRPFIPKIEILRKLQHDFQHHTNCRDFSAIDNISPGICHEVAREFIQDDIVPERIAEVMVGLFEAGSPQRQEVLAGLAEVRSKLGSPGAADRVARIASELVGARG